jgi:hypothetical protein
MKKTANLDLVVLPMILVRNQIGDIFGTEAGNFTCQKNKVKI